MNATGKLVALAIAIVAGSTPAGLLAQTFRPAGEKPAGVQTGTASWYGHKHQGRRTASGQPFDPRSPTAAHKTLPLGTVVRVTNLKTGQSAKVRVNDRGPYVPGRIIDLSAAASKALGMTKSGIAPVRIEVFASDQKQRRAETLLTRH